MEGAVGTASGDGGTFTTKTNWIGDFWLRGLPDGDWTVTIEGQGKKKVLEVSTKQEDVGLGDVPLN